MLKILKRSSILTLNPEGLKVMKKIYIAMAVLVTAMLSSCEREKDINGMTPVGENGIAFVLGDVSTRSADVHSMSNMTPWLSGKGFGCSLLP